MSSTFLGKAVIGPHQSSALRGTAAASFPCGEARVLTAALSRSSSLRPPSSVPGRRIQWGEPPQRFLPWPGGEVQGNLSEGSPGAFLVTFAAQQKSLAPEGAKHPSSTPRITKRRTSQTCALRETVSAAFPRQGGEPAAAAIPALRENAEKPPDPLTSCPGSC